MYNVYVMYKGSNEAVYLDTIPAAMKADYLDDLKLDPEVDAWSFEKI